MQIEDIDKEWQEDCKLSSYEIVEDTRKTPILHSKYLNYLTNVKYVLLKKEMRYRDFKLLKSKYYKGEATREELEVLKAFPFGVKLLKSEIEDRLKIDPDLCKLEEDLEYYKILVYMLENILSQVKARDWQIKNIISWEQFKAGV